MTDWTRDDPNAFLENPEVEMQIMFIGGGNAYVLFRHGSECAKVNRFLAKYLLDRTYSLNLAVAVVKRTESYADDYDLINNRLREIKASMPLNMPIGALPFMAADSITGAPLTHKDRDGNYYSTEASLKRAAFPKQEDEKIFDNMVTEKGSSSTLAVFHIDGNSMGNTIKTAFARSLGRHEAGDFGAFAQKAHFKPSAAHSGHAGNQIGNGITRQIFGHDGSSVCCGFVVA